MKLLPLVYFCNSKILLFHIIVKIIDAEIDYCSSKKLQKLLNEEDKNNIINYVKQLMTENSFYFKLKSILNKINSLSIKDISLTEVNIKQFSEKIKNSIYKGIARNKTLFTGDNTSNTINSNSKEDTENMKTPITLNNQFSKWSN
jgi:hypothetical protein